MRFFVFQVRQNKQMQINKNSDHVWASDMLLLKFILFPF